MRGRVALSHFLFFIFQIWQFAAKILVCGRRALMEHIKSQQGGSFHVMKDKYCCHHVTARDVQSRQQSLRIEQS